MVNVTAIKNATIAATGVVTFIVNGGVYTFQDGSSPSRCLDLAGSITADYTPIITWPCTGGANQQWKAQSVSGGFAFSNIASPQSFLSYPSAETGLSPISLYQQTMAHPTNTAWDATQVDAFHISFFQSFGGGIQVLTAWPARSLNANGAAPVTVETFTVNDNEQPIDVGQLWTANQVA